MSTHRRHLSRARRRTLSLEFELCEHETEAFALWLPDPDEPVTIEGFPQAADLAFEVLDMPVTREVLALLDERRTVTAILLDPPPPIGVFIGRCELPGLEVSFCQTLSVRRIAEGTLRLRPHYIPAMSSAKWTAADLPDLEGRTFVVTGANSGIGRATAIHLAARGHDVFGTVRSRDKAGKLQSMAADAGGEVHLVELDVADDESVRRGFAEIFAATGGVVEVLVNNAGVGGNTVVEETTPAMYLDVMNINLCGAARCLQQVLPGMRERRRGSIVNITSVTGRLAAIAQSPYVASKWAFEGVSEELAHELAPFGIRVAIIEPGVTKSAIFAKNVDAPNQSGAYDVAYRRMFQFYAAGLANATDPFEVAALVHHAVTTDEPQLRYPVSWGGRELMEGRAALRDEDWVALGAHDDDDAYYADFQQKLGLDLQP
ncbi:MAG: SDR family oxidoreductase [Actinobacteria bacterium]|nr:SDR family oxidoreductase [Actinomycetota bacterium]